MKTSLDVDRDAAAQAAAVLGTATLKDTVNTALREVVAADRRRRLAGRVRSGTLPVPTVEQLRRLRAAKSPPG